MAENLACTKKFDNIIAELRKKFRLVVDWNRTFEDLIVLRCDLSSEKEANDFLKTYSDVTRSSWIVLAKISNPNRVLLHKYWVCQHSKKRKDGNSKRNTDCPSSVDIVVKKVNRFTKRNDHYLKMSPPLCSVIRIIYPNHNHNVDSTWFLQMLRVSTETKNQFFSYFDNGMMPMKAKHVHESRIIQRENSAELLKNCAINPSIQQVYYLRKIWYSRQLGKLSDSGEGVSDVMKCYMKTGKFSKVKDLLVLKSQLLKERTAEMFDSIPESLSSPDEDSQSSEKLELVKSKYNGEPPSNISSNGGCVSKSKSSPVVVYLYPPRSNSKHSDDDDSVDCLNTSYGIGQKNVKSKCKERIFHKKPIVLYPGVDEALKEPKSIPGELSSGKSSCLPVVVALKKMADECKIRTNVIKKKSSVQDTQSRKRILLPKPRSETGVSSSSIPVKETSVPNHGVPAIGPTTPPIQRPILPVSTSNPACNPVPQSVLPSFINATVGTIIMPPPVIFTCATNPINSVNLTLPAFQFSSPSTFISVPTLVPKSVSDSSLSGNQCVGQILTSIPAPLQLIPGSVNCGVTIPSSHIPVNVPTVINVPNSTSVKHLNLKTKATGSVLPSIVSSSTISEEKFHEVCLGDKS